MESPNLDSPIDHRWFHQVWWHLPCCTWCYFEWGLAGTKTWCWLLSSQSTETQKVQNVAAQEQLCTRCCCIHRLHGFWRRGNCMEAIDNCLVLFASILSLLRQHFVKKGGDLGKTKKLKFYLSLMSTCVCTYYSQTLTAISDTSMDFLNPYLSSLPRCKGHCNQRAISYKYYPRATPSPIPALTPLSRHSTTTVLVC